MCKKLLSVLLTFFLVWTSYRYFGQFLTGGVLFSVEIYKFAARSQRLAMVDVIRTGTVRV